MGAREANTEAEGRRRWEAKLVEYYWCFSLGENSSVILLQSAGKEEKDFAGA